MGVIINKPTKFSLGESLPDLEESPVREAKLFARADAATIFAAKPEALWTQMERRASASKVRYIQR